MSMELTGNIVMKVKHHIFSPTAANPQIFSFPDGFISDSSSSFELEVQQTKMPVSGPMGNIGNDFSGVGKTITVSGVLYDQPSTVVSNNNITTKEQMKYWLESLANGFQSRPCEINSKLDEFSLRNSGGNTTVEGVSIPGNWQKTKGYLINYSFNKVVGDVETISYSLTFWVAGI